MNASLIATTNFKHVHSRDIEAVHKQFEEDGKRPLIQSTGSCLTKAVVGVILIFLSLLQISLAYQFGKSVIPGATSSDEDIKNDPMIASSEESKGKIFPEFNEITPTNERKYDIVMLGCTGFTGRLASTIYLSKMYQGEFSSVDCNEIIYVYIIKGLKLPSSYVVKKDVKWAIAGRSQAKLDKLKEELVKKIQNNC